MPITDWDGTVSHEIAKVAEWDGTVSRKIQKISDWDGTVSRLIYTSWNGELLDKNNQYTEVTGGWGATMQFSALGATEAQINSDGIVFDKFGVWQKKNTLKKINVAQYNFIDIEIQCPKGIYTNNFYFGLYRELTDSHNNAVELTPTIIDRRNENTTTVILELNGLSGEYYVAMAMLPVNPYNFTSTKIFLH